MDSHRNMRVFRVIITEQLMLIRNDLTGRKYVCLGKQEHFCLGWSSSFTLGKMYYECNNAEFCGSNILVEKDVLYLHDDNGDLKYADTLEFTEVDMDNINFRLVISRAIFSLN